MSDVARRPFLVTVAASLLVAAVGGLRRWRGPRFVERTAPGDRFRTLTLGNRPLHIREDLIRSGWLRDFRFHDVRREPL